MTHRRVTVNENSRSGYCQRIDVETDRALQLVQPGRRRIQGEQNWAEKHGALRYSADQRKADDHEAPFDRNQ